MRLVKAQRKKFASKLALTEPERAALRRVGLRLADVAGVDPAYLILSAGFSETRANRVVFAARVQSFQSVGPATVDDLLALGINSMDALAAAEPTELFSRLCRLTGKRQDPCVEDHLRTTVAQARWSDLTPHQRNWWFWSTQRGERLRHPG